MNWQIFPLPLVSAFQHDAKFSILILLEWLDACGDSYNNTD
jgi:hypothetical protein